MGRPHLPLCNLRGSDMKREKIMRCVFHKAICSIKALVCCYSWKPLLFGTIAQKHWPLI